MKIWIVSWLMLAGLGACGEGLSVGVPDPEGDPTLPPVSAPAESKPIIGRSHVQPVEPPDTLPTSGPACGSLTCAADEYCEIVVSDVPEFSGEYRRHACQPMPGCLDGLWASTCACIEATERCAYGSAAYTGECTEASTRLTLLCGIGG
jgi:hypothetical protein